MAVAKIDANTRGSLTAVSSDDGVTIVDLWADPTTHRLLTDSANSATPGDPDTSVQFNDGGSFGGDSQFYFDKSLHRLFLGAENETGKIAGPDATTTDSIGGALTFFAGFGNGAGEGGGIEMDGGTGGNNGNGGGISLFAGDGGATSGTGGNVTITAGSTSDEETGAGGTVLITGGTNPDGGGPAAIYVGGGYKDGTPVGGTLALVLGQGIGGTNGDLTVQNGAGIKSILEFDSVASSDKTFTFPNTTGTLALVPGATTQIAYNLSGALSADSRFTYTQSSNDRNVFIGLANFSSSVVQIYAEPSGGTGATGESSIYLQNNNGGASVTINAKDGGAYVFVDDSNVVGTNGKVSIGAIATDSVTPNATIKVQATGSTKYGYLIFDNVTSTDKVFTFPNATGTVSLIANTETLTNKRITKRVLALSAGSATPAINTDSYDVVHITAQSAAITSFTSSLTGTPVDGDTLRISITDNGSARALTWGASFESSGNITLPTTTVVSTRLDVGFFWNTETTKWRCVAVA